MSHWDEIFKGSIETPEEASEPTPSVNTQLKHFMLQTDISERGNEWLEDATMKVYVRRTQHSINHKLVKTLDLASVEVNPNYQHQGLNKKFVEIAKILARERGLVVFIENVETPEVEKKVIGYGFTKIRVVHEFELFPSYYWIPK